MPRCSPHALARDLLAGVTVGLVLIPQSLAYASVAGMPPVAGLYAAALPLIAAALFASSPYLQTGPVATTSLLTFGALAGRAPVGSQEYLELGILLALVVGVVRALLGVLRAGWIAHLMSVPMLMGFLPAGALLIAASQTPAVLGVSPEGGVTAAAASALAHPEHWDPVALAMAGGVLLIVAAGRRLHRFVPGVLVALLAGLVAGHALADRAQTIGSIPPGLPTLGLHLPSAALASLLVPATVIAFVGFAEAASTARMYATRERQHWSASREFVSQGVANIVAGASGGLPVGASLSRTALNHSAGAATRLSGAFTGLVVLAFLPFASVLEPLPRPVLAAIVIGAVVGLLRLPQMVALWRISRPQFGIAWTTFGLTLLLAPHVEWAVLAGVALSVAVHLMRELSLRLDVRVVGDELEVRPAGVLWFATAHDLQERLIELLGHHPHARTLRLSLDGLGRIDLTGAMTLAHTLEDVRAAGLAVEVSGVPPQARGLLERYAEWRGALD
ncbi:MAG TPA: SulP family inorganic anion transporter [Solirubrobacteraceae bacterium]